MNKRELLRGALTGATAVGLGSTLLSAQAQNAPVRIGGSILLTVSGAIGKGNRGPSNPALDQMMAKQGISFTKAHVFDFATLNKLRPVSITPTLEYDNKPHTLRGPLLTEVIKATGAQASAQTVLMLRAVDGYTVELGLGEADQRHFIVATHIDHRPMALGGLGPLWAVYDADNFPDMAAKPVTERFAKCPWALYHIEVKAG